MKIIASDFDGTLNHGGIDDKKRETIKKWRKSGNLFAIVSGRSPEDALSIIKDNNIEIDYFLANNGAVILNRKGEKLCDVRCAGEIALPIIELLFKCRCPYGHVQTDFPCRVYADKNDCRRNGEYTLENVPEIPYFNQISSYLPDCKTAENVIEILKENFGDVINPMQNGICIDIVRADMDKAKGIYMLLNIVGAKREDVIAVGDNVNDRDMIEEFRSYAMENGVDFIKKIADNTISSVTELIEKEI